LDNFVLKREIMSDFTKPPSLINIFKKENHLLLMLWEKYIKKIK